MQSELATYACITGHTNYERTPESSQGWPGLERSDYPGGVSHKKSWEMSPFRPEVACQQVTPQLGEADAIVVSEQTSCACGTPVAAPRQPVPPAVKSMRRFLNEAGVRP